MALRLRRICSSDTDYQKKSGEYISHLQRRGYKEQSIKAVFKNTGAIPKNQARKKVSKQ